jgi:exonuclease SbcD
MRVLHTSDWHLGHTLREVTRELEHEAFLGWLRATIVAEACDVLLITGDVFDSATPPATAERMWFEFLAGIRTARPGLDVVVIAGNHDSPARLAAAAAVLRSVGVHVIAQVPRGVGGVIDHDRWLISVAGGRGLVAAVPYLRPLDLPADDAGAVAAIYREAIEAARARRGPDQALIVLGHLNAAGGEPSAMSERPISIGGQATTSPAIFPDDATYVALGHLHRAQRVGRETIRYAGSPLPLALDEGPYRHEVRVIDFAGAAVVGQRGIRVPRTVDVVRVPARGVAGLDEVLAGLAALPGVDPEEDPRRRPYLEVAVALTEPAPRLRAAIEAALEGRRPRLIRLVVELTGDGAALAERVLPQALAELDPAEVFLRRWAKLHAAAPDAEVMAAFGRLLREVRGDGADPEATGRGAGSA